MGNEKFEALCKRTVVDYFNAHVDKTDNKRNQHKQLQSESKKNSFE